ncbi:MAG: ATP-binding protein [Myxococcota bacterium]|nr:ATP-binding protein [Myxococcota bacterium]
MRLTWKIALTIAVTICVVLGVDGYLRVHRQIALFEADIERDHLSMGRATAAALTEAWLSHGEQLALELIEGIGRKTKRVLIRWIPLSQGNDSTLDRARYPQDMIDQVVKSKQPMSWISSSKEAGRRLSTYVPVVPTSNVVGVIEITESLAPQKTYIRTTILRTVVTTLVMIVICVAATFLLGLVLVGRPVRRLVQKARSIGKGDFSGRLEFRTNDEIADLAEEMNTMADQLYLARKQVESETTARLETLEQLRHADRLKTVGQLTSGVVHEIGTPLTVIAGRAKMISTAEAEGEEARNCARIVVEQTEKVTKIIRQILDFSRRGEKQKSNESLDRIAGEMVMLLSPVAVNRGIYLEFETSGAAVYEAHVDRSQIQQVLANLIVNGIQAAKAGGRVHVRLALERATNPDVEGGEPRSYWALSIRDDGDGIPENIRQRIFEPFFTTKASGSGTGLGLAISREIIREHGGWIDATSEPESGACFTFYLPAEKGEE